ncbi:LysR substrate binding domain protein [compost metagenome]
MLTAVLAGCGFSQLPLWLVIKHLENGSLLEVLKGHSGGEMPISAIWPKSRQLMPKIRKVIDTIVTAANDGLLN